MDGGLFSSLRDILRTVAGNFTPEAGRAPTIESVFGDSPPRKINDEVYEIHHPGSRPKFEIVFFHGLELGHYQDSYWKDWLCADHSHCWPKTWLIEDFHDARVLSVSFDSSLTQTPSSGRMDLYQITENLERSLIHDAKVGQKQCPVVMVGHSLGGMVMKGLCTRANQSAQDHQLEFLINLKGLFFYATPHNGSMLSQNLRKTHGELMVELKVLDQHSVRLNSDFGKFLKKYPSIKLRGVGENRVTNFGKFSDMIVLEGSARSDRYDHYHTVSVDHFDISKPASKTDLGRYKFLVDFISHVILIEEMEKQMRSALLDSQRSSVHHPAANSAQASSNLQQMTKVTAMTKCYSFSSANYSTDSYVRLERTERKIYSALEKSDAPSPTMVLIYGAPGRGKSTVARQVGLSLGRSKERFAHALFLECDRQKEVAAAETGLLQGLREEDSFQNVRLLEYASDVANKQTLSILVQTFEGEKPSERFESREKLLKSFVRKEKLLIILDDVIDRDFVRHFLNLSGGGVKFIITARQNICEGLSYKYTPIRIEDLRGQDDETSKRILAVHAGLPDQFIPDDCKAVAEEILSKADGLPLVIAQIGRILRPDNCNLEVWKSVADNFFECLNENPFQDVLSAGYNHTIWAVMKQSYEACSEKAQELLLLLGMCDGSSVSEAVLQFLYDVAFSGGERTKVHLFQEIKAELKNWELVSENQEKCLSLHSSTKHFILVKMTEKVNEMAGKFLHQQLTKRSIFPEMNLTGSISHVGNSVEGWFPWRDPHINQQSSQSTSRDDRFITILSCLYLDTRVNFRKQIILESHYSDDTFSPLKRSVVEPLTHLLVSQRPFCSDRSQTELSTPAMQIFLQFIGDDTLDYHHLLQLLDGPGSVMKTLQFLENVSLLEGAFWEKNDISHVVLSIYNIFKDSTHQDVNVQAWNTLVALCQVEKKINADNVDQFSSLDCLVQSPSGFENHDLRVNAAFLFATITDCADATICNRIANRPKFLESLAVLLSQDATPVLQTHAAVALANLAYASEVNQERIFNIRGLPEQLVQSVVQDQNSDLAANAASVIRNLTATENLNLEDHIACVPNLLRSLAASLPKATNPLLQTRAAGALANLVSGHEPNRERIFNVHRLPKRLVWSVAQDQNSDLAAKAASVFRNLTDTENLNLKDQIARVPNLLESLAASLSKVMNPHLQTHAAAALGNLTIGSEPNQERIFSVSGLPKQLVQSVAQDQNSDLAANGASVIQGLTATENLSLKDQIARVPNLLESLAASLSKATNPHLQTHAAAALGNLTIGPEPNRERIFSISGLPKQLVQSVVQDQNSDLAANAASVIWDLTATENVSLKDQIARVPNLLESLAASLPKVTNFLLRSRAAAALANLAVGHGPNQVNIFNIRGLSEQLVQSMAQDQNFDLAANAARMIGNLASTRNLSLKYKIACVPNLLESLAASLPKVTNPHLQTHVAAALGNLTIGSEPNRDRIFRISGLPKQLVQSVTQDQNSDLAANAASVIRGLTATENLNLKDQIARVPNLLESLAASLPKATNPHLQTHAARALANLALGYEPNLERIFSISDLPKQLVQSVAQDQNSDLVANAALVIWSLTATENLSLEDQIACVPNLLESLAASLPKATNPLLQSRAAVALSNLTIGHEPSEWRIFSVRGLPKQLVQAVAQDQNFDLAANGALVIRNLTATKNLSLKDQIARVPNLLESLAASLSKATNPHLQTHAAAALGNLTIGPKPNRERIFSISGLPKQLVQSVAQDQTSYLAANAASVIRNLTATENLSLKDQIARVPNLLESLAASLPKVTNPHLQTHAAAALGNLTIGSEPNRERIFNIHGIPEQLVQSMTQDQNFDLAANAARMIGNLASTRNLSLKYKIACVPNLLESLRSASAHRERRDLQRWAAEALANLGHGP